jgi:S1-C subfamily serine protease
MIAFALLLLLTDWPSTAETLNKSVVTVISADGSCTGFVVNAHAKNDKDYILTAAHCDGKDLYADHAVAKVIWKDAKKDLLILEVDDLDRPAVSFAPKNPIQGEEIASLGYGMSLEQPMFRLAHVSNAAIAVPEIEGGPFVMIDAAFVPGQSGGPVVNAAGEVVSIVQRASGLVGIGVGTEQIRSAIKRYLEKPKP